MMDQKDMESGDAKKVDQAMESLFSGDIDKAEQLLLSVIANTPDNYLNETENDEGMVIKFWDQMSFVHFVMWNESHGISKGVTWVGNAYPRAYFYLGFIAVKKEQFDKAFEYLDKGQQLEPSNPKFKFEKGPALLRTGKKEEALAVFENIGEPGPYCSDRDLATGLRGRGSALIELERLDEAKSAFKESLKFDPDSKIAQSELQYIDYLEQGGSPDDTGYQLVESDSSQSITECSICGQQYEIGEIFVENGVPVSICSKCNGKINKKWWQFWK